MRLRSRTITWLAAALAVGILRVLFFTVRQELRPEEPRTVPYLPPNPEAFLISVWHDSLLMPSFGGTVKYSAALVSRHQDGSYLAYLLRILRMTSVRGSTGRGGAQALRQLITVAKKKHIVITPDGPRGPRRRVKTGIVFLASQTGRGIVPTAFTYRRSWRIKGSWTDLEIPKPFTKAYLLAAHPIYVPPDQSRDELERYTQRVQDEMNRLNAEAEQLAGLSGARVDEASEGHMRSAA